jgi:hypothetical protein
MILIIIKKKKRVMFPAQKKKKKKKKKKISFMSILLYKVCTFIVHETLPQKAGALGLRFA